jgi:hypothetical protein
VWFSCTMRTTCSMLLRVAPSSPPPPESVASCPASTECGAASSGRGASAGASGGAFPSRGEARSFIAVASVIGAPASATSAAPSSPPQPMRASTNITQPVCATFIPAPAKVIRSNLQGSVAESQSRT